jgi:hypothetical protein
MTFDLENAWDALDEAISPSGQKKVASELNGALAEIERLRAELARVNHLRETEIDQAGAAERMYLEAARLKDARIQELEDALVEVRARSFSGWVEESRVVWDVVRQQIWIEGKIGPDATRRSWQITDEREEAFGRILRRLEYDQSLPGRTNHKIQRAMELLRAMLREAGQE